MSTNYLRSFPGNLLGIIAILLLWNNATGQYLYQLSADGIKEWHYYGGEEFNQSEIPEQKWLTRFPWSRAGLAQSIYFSESNVILDSGLVKFRVTKEPTVVQLAEWETDSVAFLRYNNFPDSNRNIQLDYTGGLIWSKEKYKYGYFELRFKSPSSIGIWPAFWLFGEQNNEIDIMELKGERPNQIHFDVHCPIGCRNYITGPFNRRKAFGHWIKTTDKLSENFNVIAAEWQPEYIRFYLNGHLAAVFNGSIDVPLALTVGSGNAYKGGPFPPAVGKNTNFPSDFLVDYLRIWTTDSTINGSRLDATDFAVFQKNNSTPAEPKKKRIKFFRKGKGYDASSLTLSVLPSKSKVMLLTLLGPADLRANLFVRFKDQQGNIFYELKTDSPQPQTVSLANYKQTKVTLEIKYEDSVITKTLLLYAD